MHYKNGREAKNGDKVVHITDYAVTVGILYDATAAIAASDGCKAKS